MIAASSSHRCGGVRALLATRPWVWALFVLTVAGHGGPALALPPDVVGVHFAQRTDGSGFIDVWYDLIDPDSEAVAVTLRASDDGGATWNMPCRTVALDVGENVSPGANKRIVWNFAQDNAGVVTDELRLEVVASDAGVLFPAHSPRHVAIADLNTIDWLDPHNVEKYARADIVILTCAFLWHRPLYEAAGIVDQIKAINPECLLFGYMNWKNVYLEAENSTSAPLNTTLLERTRDWWSYTTTGDTLMDWPGKVVLDILAPECRDIVVDTYVEFQTTTNNPMDGIFWDYFGDTLWIPPEVEIDGEPDLDSDGIAHWVDLDEQEAYRGAQDAMVRSLRQILGEDFIQVFNGQRAYDDLAFASLADGLFYETFPAIFFPNPDMAHALDPDYPYSLFNVRSNMRSRNGGPFIILSNLWENFYTDHNGEVQRIDFGDMYRAVALLIDGYSSWSDTTGVAGGYTYGWTRNDISLGAPLGPTVIEGNRYTRDFIYGRLELELTSGHYPNPYDYRILVRDRVIEELAIPYHYP